MKTDPVHRLLDAPYPYRDAEPCLQLHGLSKRFGSQTVLQQIDLTVYKGEFISLLGPSGCGKTTLLRCIAGLDQPDQGRIELHGQDVTRLPPARRDYGIVFQSYALFPNLNVADNIAYGLRGNKEARRKRVTELLALIGLDAYATHYPAQLSGGQQQRVALARALATSPSLLLLDEPLSALDARVREHQRREIRQLQQQLGITTVMVTHDQEEALTMADRVVVMHRGGIEQSGTPHQIYRQPASPFVASFVGQGNFLPVQICDDGRVQLGEHHYAIPHTLAVGQAASLFIRPEDLRLHPEGELPDHTVWAERDKQELLGALYRITLRVPAWGQHTVQVDLGHEALSRLGQAQRVALSLPLNRVHLFPLEATC